MKTKLAGIFIPLTTLGLTLSSQRTEKNLLYYYKFTGENNSELANTYKWISSAGDESDCGGYGTVCLVSSLAPDIWTFRLLIAIAGPESILNVDCIPGVDIENQKEEYQE